MADRSPERGSARESVLGSIRRALARQPGPAGGVDTPALAWSQLPRDYRRAFSLDRTGLLHLLEDRLRDYDAGVYCCAPHEVAGIVAHVLMQRGKRRIAIPAGLEPGWTAAVEPGELQFVTDSGDDLTLGSCDGVLTGATVAIAQTGSVVLQNVAGQGRRAVTLLPDYHLCVLRSSDVVETLPEAMARLQGSATLPMTFFSGPSATADIEMTRVKGVHGPRFVDVVIVLE